MSASSSSSWSRSLNFPTSLSPTFQLLRRHSLGSPGEHQLGSNARACGRRRLGMWAPKPGAKGSSPCKVGGPAGATVGEGLFGAPVVHSWRRLWDHAGCILGTGALLQTMRPPPRVALWVRFGGVSCSSTLLLSDRGRRPWPFGSTFQCSGRRGETSYWRLLTLALPSLAWRRGISWGQATVSSNRISVAPALGTPRSTNRAGDGKWLIIL